MDDLSTSPIPAYWLYGEARPGGLPDALHIETIEARSAPLGGLIEPHRHRDLHQFFLVTAGGGTVGIDGARWPMPAGTAVAMPPLAVHGFEFAPGTDGFVASVAEPALSPLADRAQPLATLLARPIRVTLARDEPAFEELRAMMAATLAEFAANRLGRDLALDSAGTLIALWFARVAGRSTIDGVVARDPRARIVQRFIDLVETDYRTHRPLAAYAGQLGVTVPHLSRCCRAVLGQSAARVVQDRLMLEARRLLAYSSRPVAQIGYALGFADPAYFSRCFTERTGHSPSAYRAQR